MVLKKVGTVFKVKDIKPSRFVFKNSIRLGFKGNRVVEVTKFRNVKR